MSPRGPSAIQRCVALLEKMNVENQQALNQFHQRLGRVEEVLQRVQDELAEETSVGVLRDEMIEMGRELRDVQGRMEALGHIEIIDLTREEKGCERRRHHPYRHRFPTPPFAKKKTPSNGIA